MSLLSDPRHHVLHSFLQQFPLFLLEYDCIITVHDTATYNCNQVIPICNHTDAWLTLDVISWVEGPGSWMSNPKNEPFTARGTGLSLVNTGSTSPVFGHLVLPKINTKWFYPSADWNCCCALAQPGFLSGGTSRGDNFGGHKLIKIASLEAASPKIE